jgi:hypothetical protein
MSYCDAIGTVGIILIYATIMYIYFVYCRCLLPEQCLDILLCETNSTSRALSLSRGDPTVKAALTKSYSSVVSTKDEIVQLTVHTLDNNLLLEILLTTRTLQQFLLVSLNTGGL